MRESFDELVRTDARECRPSPGRGGPIGHSANGCSTALNGRNQPEKPLRELDHTDVAAFTDQLLNLPEERVTDQIQTYLHDGQTVSTVFGTLLAGAANELGERWESDSCSFADVTLGMAIVHRLLRSYSDSLSAELPTVQGDPVILVTPLPGESHIFAAALLAEHFRAAGWRVHSGIYTKMRALVESVGERHVDVVAVTVSDVAKIEEAERLIRQVRSRSKNSDVRFMVGGGAFVSDPVLHQAVGAEATATDALEALVVASQLAAL